MFNVCAGLTKFNLIPLGEKEKCMESMQDCTVSSAWTFFLPLFLSSIYATKCIHHREHQVLPYPRPPDTAKGLTTYQPMPIIQTVTRTQLAPQNVCHGTFRGVSLLNRVFSRIFTNDTKVRKDQCGCGQEFAGLPWWLPRFLSSIASWMEGLPLSETVVNPSKTQLLDPEYVARLSLPELWIHEHLHLVFPTIFVEFFREKILVHLTVCHLWSSHQTKW